MDSSTLERRDGQQLSHFVEDEPQPLRSFDELQARYIVIAIAPDTTGRPLRLADQAAPLVVTHGFHANACRFSQGADGQAGISIFHT